MVRGFLSFLLDFLVPSVCLVCGCDLRLFDSGVAFPPALHWPPWSNEFFSTDFGLEVFGGVRIPAAVLCPGCWLSLEPARSHGFLAHPNASAAPVPLISPFFTNDPLLALIRFLKFSGGRSAAPALGWWMASALQDYIAGAVSRGSFDPLLVPVPLHPSREKSRGYNQAALLAWEVADRLDLKVESRILRRTKNTKSQSKLERDERAENVRNAFGLEDGSRATGKDIILVDDLVTTGETIGSCIETLAETSPASVAVLSAGRVK